MLARICCDLSIVVASGLLRFSALRRPGRMAICQATSGLTPGRLATPCVSSIPEGISFFAVQQAVGFDHIIDVAGRGAHRVYQSRFSVHADVGLHSEMPLVARLALVHLRVAPAAGVLGRTRPLSACAHRCPVRLRWATVLKRLFEFDLWYCPNGGGRLKIIAAIRELPVIEKILTHLGPQARPQPRAPASGSPPQAT